MRTFFKLLLVIAIIGGGAFIAVQLIQFKPKAKKMQVSLGAPAVKTIVVEPETETVYVSATGTVIPRTELVLVPRVSGAVVNTHQKLIPGEHLKKGELLIKIDDRDYKIAVEQSKAAVVKAETEMKMEKAKQVIAEREWALLNDGKTKIKGLGSKEASKWGKELALRKPQAASFEAALKAAKSALEKSRLDLSRTVIKCPFNAILLDKYVTAGRYVTPGAQLLRIAGTDRYWIRATVPVDKLVHIKIPGMNVSDGLGSTVRISMDTGITDGDDRIDDKAYRKGRVLRLEGELEAKSRMARLIIAVDDPLLLTSEAKSGKNPLLLGSYVNVSIEADVLTDVYAVPRHGVHENGTVFLAVKNDDSGKTGKSFDAEFIEKRDEPVEKKGTKGSGQSGDQVDVQVDVQVDMQASTSEYKLAIIPVEEVWRKKNDILVKGLYPGASVIVSRIPAPIEGMELQVLQ